MSIIFDRINKLIIVEAPATAVTIQELVNAIRDWEDELENMDLPQIAFASGKDILRPGLMVGVTLRLLNGWRLKFEDRPGPDWVRCDVTGGNLTAVDEAGEFIDPIAPSAYVTVYGVSDVSAGLIAEWTETEKSEHIATAQEIKAKTDYIPSDLPDVPTHPELIAQHGSGSWEGATPAQVWGHSERTLSTRDIPEVPGEEIASEGTLGEIKGPAWTDESLKKIKEAVDELETAVKEIKVGGARFEV